MLPPEPLSVSISGPARQRKNEACLGTPAALTTALHRIPVILMVATVFFYMSSCCFLQEPCNVIIYETCSIDLRKTTDRAALGAHVTLAAALQRILVVLAVVAVYF